MTWSAEQGTAVGHSLLYVYILAGFALNQTFSFWVLGAFCVPFGSNDHRFDVLCARLQLLGFPVQLIGVAALPYFYVKYAVEGDSIVDDLGAAAVRTCQKYHRNIWSSRPMCNSILHAVCLYMHLDGASISARVEFS